MIALSPATPEPTWAAIDGPTGVRGVASRADALVGLLRRVWRAVAGLGDSHPSSVSALQTLTYELPLTVGSPPVDFGRPGGVLLSPRQGSRWHVALYSYPVRRARRTEYRFALWADRVPASGKSVVVTPYDTGSTVSKCWGVALKSQVTTFAAAKEPEVAVLATHLTVVPPLATTKSIWSHVQQYKLAALLAPRLDYATAEELFTPYLETTPHAVTTWERVLRELSLPVDVRDKINRMLDAVTTKQMKAAHDLM